MEDSDLYPIPVRKGRSVSKYTVGYIDKSGSVVIPPIFDMGDWFFEGLAAVMSDGKWGFIDATGEWVISPRSLSPARYSEGLGAIYLGSGAGYANLSGEIAIDCEYETVGVFSEGCAWVRVHDTESYFITADGHRLDCGPFELAGHFSEGLAAVQSGERWGFVDKAGRYVILPQFGGDIAGPFTEGLAKAAHGAKFGFINRDGDWMIEPQWRSVLHFNEGLAPVYGDDRRFAGYVDKLGDLCITPDRPTWFGRHFTQGLATLTTDTGAGVMNRNRDWVIEPKYRSCGQFRSGLCPVVGDDHIAYVDMGGNEVWTGKYVDHAYFTWDPFI